MTTTVTVDAHCADTIEVDVTVFDGLELVDHTVLQDGESVIQHVYDDRKITIRELEKK